MRVSEVMQTDVETVSPAALLTDVAKLMKEGDFGSVPVVEGDDVIGMVTDRDIVVRAVATGRDLTECRVQDVMTKDVLSCHEGDDVDNVSRLMSDRQVRRIVVLDQDEKLAGIVALADLARRDQSEAGEALGDISEPQHSEPTRAH